MLLFTSILLFFRAGWWLYQVDNVYLKHVIDEGKKSDLGKRLINTCVWWRRNLMLLGLGKILLNGWCLYPVKFLSKDYVKRSPLPRRIRRKRRKLYGQLDHLDDGDIYHLHILSLSRRIQDERVHHSHKCNRSHKYCWGAVDLDELSYMVDLHAPPVKVRERKGVPIDDLLNELFPESPGDPAETFNQRSEARRNTSSARGKRRSNNLLRLPIRTLLLITPILLPTVSATPAINQHFSFDPSVVAPAIAVVGGAATALSSYTNRPTENQTLPPVVHARNQTQNPSFSSQQLSAFWYAINSFIRDKKKTKSKVIKDLETETGLGQRTLNRYFDAATHKRWNWNVIEQLLSNEKHPMWSDEWKKAVDLVSRSEFGPPVAEIESYFREHYAEYPPQTTAVSPMSVPTHSPAAFSHSEVDIDDMEQFLFSEDGSLNPTVAELIMCNLSRDTPLSKKEDGLRKALQTKWGEENDVQVNNQVNFRREMACLTLRPKSRKQDRANSSSWTSVEDATVNKRRMREDAKDLQAILETISRFDLVRAAHAIASVLSTNKVLQETVYDLTYSDESESLPKQILDGIKECLSHHTISTGTRPKESEYLVKHLLLGCVFKLHGTVSTNKIKNLLGTTAEEVNQAIDQAKLLRESGEQVQAYTRKKRKDYIRGILKKYIFRFLEDDDYTRLDTNQKPTRQVNPLLDTDEKVDVASRIWLIPTLLDRYRFFLESKYFEEFKADHGASVGFTIFREVLSEVGKFVSEQTERSCVDDVISNLEWAMRAMKKLLSLEEVQQQLESCPCNHDGLQHADFMKMLNGASYKHVVKGVCCPEHVYEDQPKDEEGKYLKTTQKKCAYGKCQNCGVAKKLDGLLNQLEEMEGIPEIVEVLRWEKAARQGTDDKGNQNSQLELTSTQMEIKDFIQHFKDCANECIPHYHRIKWIGWDLKHDYNALSDDEGFILTDFGATTNLKATEKVNSATDAHLACCNFVVLTNRRTVKVNKQLEDGSFEEEDVIVYDVKYFHFLAGTLTKGKKADWRMHQVCLDKILEIMNREEGITKFKYWTDNAPHQYKCRQTFISDASIADRHPLIELIHKFAVVAQFKGPHDASGKWIGATLTLLEKCFVRNPTAYEAFKHLNEYLVKNKANAKDWKKLEADHDPALKNKGVFGMDERNVFFVGETQEEVDQMKEKDPELSHLMLVCDRTHTISAEEALHNTAQIQYIRSIQTTESQKSPREHPAIVSTEGCNCKDCLVDPLNNVCIHAEHRNTREVILKATDPSPKEIPQFIDSKVIVTYRNGKNKANVDKIGRIIGYENTTKKPGGKNEWKFRVTLDQDVDEFEDDGSQCDEYLHYDEASYSIERYDEFMKQNELPISEWAAANPHFIKCRERNCNNKAQATCSNHMCKDCCMGEMAAIPCTLVSHNCTEDTATSSNQATPSNQAKPSRDYEDLLKLKPELPAVIKSYTENKIIPTIKQMRAILLFCYDATTQKSRKKQFYVDKLEGMYDDDPEKLTDPEELANALSDSSVLSSD
ncbi:hypothetical protein ACHAWC_010635 [Mediolabrus comicus]